MKKNNILMDCPDCGHQVSKNAKSCPNCGTKISNVDYLKGTILFIFLSIVLWVIFGIVGGRCFMAFYFHISNT